MDGANSTDSGGGRVKFVSPGFGLENSAFASAARAFGVEGVDFSPEEEVIATRHTSGDNREPNLLRHWVGDRAPAGHPNPDDAKPSAKQILAAL